MIDDCKIKCEIIWTELHVNICRCKRYTI